MVAFWFLVALGLVGVWFLLMFLYKPLGKSITKYVDKATEQDEDEKPEEDTEKEQVDED